jgi:hypothetical protein
MMTAIPMHMKISMIDMPMNPYYEGLRLKKAYQEGQALILGAGSRAPNGGSQEQDEATDYHREGDVLLGSNHLEEGTLARLRPNHEDQRGN